MPSSPHSRRTTPRRYSVAVDTRAPPETTPLRSQRKAPQPQPPSPEVVLLKTPFQYRLSASPRPSPEALRSSPVSPPPFRLDVADESPPAYSVPRGAVAIDPRDVTVTLVPRPPPHRGSLPWLAAAALCVLLAVTVPRFLDRWSYCDTGAQEVSGCLPCPPRGLCARGVLTCEDGFNAKWQLQQWSWRGQCLPDESIGA